MISPEFKETVYKRCQEIVSTQIAEIQQAIAELSADQQGETKSSAGDKYETSRAMIQLEKDRLGQQLVQSNAMLRALKSIGLTGTNREIDLGTLVATSSGLYYLLVSLGEIPVGELSCFLVSGASPIGKMLIGKKVGDKITLQGREINILEIA